MILSALALLLAAQNVVITTHEPRSASPWVNSVRASCGAQRLAIDGYGGSKPLTALARIRINGRAVAGREMGRLVADLSHKRAVYRLQILCGYAGGIELRIGEGERLPDGPVRYRAARAEFQGGRLRAYTGFEEADADAFWFR